MDSRELYPSDEQRRRIMDFIMAAGEKLLENETVKKLVGDAQVKKIIFVPGRLLNIVC